MLSKREFETAMTAVQDFFTRMDNLYDNTEGCLDVWEMSGGGCADVALELLAKLMGDDTPEMIDYFVYDLEFGHKYKINCCTDENGKNIPLGSIDDLYSYYAERNNS